MEDQLCSCTIYYRSDPQVQPRNYQQPRLSKLFLDKPRPETHGFEQATNKNLLATRHLFAPLETKQKSDLHNQRDYEQTFHGRTKLSRSSDPTTYDSELYQPGRSIYFILQALHSMGEVAMYITLHQRTSHQAGCGGKTDLLH